MSAAVAVSWPLFAVAACAFGVMVWSVVKDCRADRRRRRYERRPLRSSRLLRELTGVKR